MRSLDLQNFKQCCYQGQLQVLRENGVRAMSEKRELFTVFISEICALQMLRQWLKPGARRDTDASS